MCRSIKTLRTPDQAYTEADIRAAALQFVRKVSGYRVPSRANQPAFDAAVDDIALATEKLLAALAAGQRKPSASAVDATPPVVVKSP